VGLERTHVRQHGHLWHASDLEDLKRRALSRNPCEDAPPASSSKLGSARIKFRTVDQLENREVGPREINQPFTEHLARKAPECHPWQRSCLLCNRADELSLVRGGDVLEPTLIVEHVFRYVSWYLPCRLRSGPLRNARVKLQQLPGIGPCFFPVVLHLLELRKRLRRRALAAALHLACEF
jgi:hypothetical protein